MSQRNYDPKFERYFKTPNPGLRAYFQRVVSGEDEEIRTPFFKHKTLKSLVSDWTQQLQPIRDKYPSLYEYEIDQAEKVGPMSIMFPLSERMKDIDSYYDSISSESIPISTEALTAALEEWSDIGRIRMRSVRNTVKVMKKSTNSGAPYFARRRDVLEKTIPCLTTYSGNRTLMQLAMGTDRASEYEACAVLGWRGQEGGPSKKDVKQRVVWMFPFSVNINELQMYQPLIEAFQNAKTSPRSPYIPAWVGNEAVDSAITMMFDTKDPDQDVICTDFTKFDQHFNKDLQDAAAYLINGLCADPDKEDWLKYVFPVKYNIPLAYDYGKVRTGPHGMGSGSGGTNADETLAHRALQHEAALSSGTKLNPYSQCLGDDGVLTFPGITVESVMRSYQSHGLEMNATKQYVSKQDCIYLRRWHSTSYRVDNVCVGVYPTTRALGRLAEQERWYNPEVWGPKMVALRQLAIIENCKYHPQFEEFVRYCMEGDKYRLGIDIPGFLDNIESEARKAIDYMPDFLGYVRSLFKAKDRGISNWRIVKYLKSLA